MTYKELKDNIFRKVKKIQNKSFKIEFNVP